MILPPLIHKTCPRPSRPDFEELYRIPDQDRHQEFWHDVYDHLRSLQIHSPVRRDVLNYIDSRFGYFGLRVHPVTREPQYFHVGISLALKAGRKIYPVADGVLEYSGYGAVNGHYVLLSHPDIKTEDGYVLHSMYCHLKKPLVKFNSYQKMLREISLGSYPEISIAKKTILGLASTTGLSRDNHPGVYLQLSFRKFNETPIVLDPVRFYHDSVQQNATADITDTDEIARLFEKKTS